MIKIVCHCGNPFEVPAELAATSIQCPKCGLLVDVPGLDDLVHIDRDGAYKMEPADLAAEHERRAEELRRAFGRGTTTASGEEIDLRPTMEQVREAGDAHIPIEMRGELRPGPPKYDPETGQLVRPLDVAPPVASLAPTAKPAPAITYASGETLHQPAGSILLRLFVPSNAIVVVVIFLAHVATSLTLTLRINDIPVFAILMVPFVAMIIAHYGAVVDETGPCGGNDLPRPLRDLSWHDDIGGPFGQVFLAMGLCYWPVVLLNRAGTGAYWIGYVLFDSWSAVDGAPGWAIFAITLALLTAGTFLLPAVLITTTTSGTIHNLRPDRVLGVIKASGARYAGAFLSGLIVIGLYAWILFGPAWLPERLRETKAATYMNGFLPRLVIYLLGAYLANWFCWQLGLIYRENEAKFPWIMQRHIPTRDRERMGLPDLSPRARAAARRRMRQARV